VASSYCDCGKPQTLVADLVINPETGQAEPINIQSVLSEEEYAHLREQMQQLLDMIMLFFEVEDKLVDSGELQAEEVRPKDCRKELVDGILGNSAEAFTTKLKLKVDRFDNELFNVEVTFVPGMQTGVLLGQERFFQNFDDLLEKRKNIFKLSSN